MKLLAAHVRVAVVAVSLSIAGGSAFARDDVAAVTDLTGKFLEAQRSFDLPALRALTAENYVEISPVGELDDRAKMLGFYAPEKKTQAPPLTIDNELTRVYGDVGIQTVKLTYTMTASGETRKLSLRATLVAHRSAGEWKMVSAQYTGIRPPPPPRN
jgi:ketosteroid isomerase-like protein